MLLKMSCLFGVWTQFVVDLLLYKLNGTNLVTVNAIVNNRGKYPPAEEYLSYVEKSNIIPVEAFKSMQVVEESLPVENGDSGHMVWMHLIFPAIAYCFLCKFN